MTSNADLRASWFACEHPERPTDAWVRWHYYACHGCWIKASALIRQYPNDSHVAWLVSFLESAALPPNDGSRS